jgi:hypothetical protein
MTPFDDERQCTPEKTLDSLNSYGCFRLGPQHDTCRNIVDVSLPQVQQLAHQAVIEPGPARRHYYDFRMVFSERRYGAAEEPSDCYFFATFLLKEMQIDPNIPCFYFC